jgi:hypothetical protein
MRPRDIPITEFEGDTLHMSVSGEKRLNQVTR